VLQHGGSVTLKRMCQLLGCAHQEKYLQRHPLFFKRENKGFFNEDAAIKKAAFWNRKPLFAL
jgi:hypothetical protein